jgi:hypothetical protein
MQMQPAKMRNDGRGDRAEKFNAGCMSRGPFYGPSQTLQSLGMQEHCLADFQTHVAGGSLTTVAGKVGDNETHAFACSLANGIDR